MNERVLFKILLLEKLVKFIKIFNYLNQQHNEEIVEFLQ
jgi:hypothetical protein